MDALTLTIPRPPREAERLSALKRYGVLDTPAEDDFDLLTEIAAALCGAPYSFVVLVDEDRAWIKSAHGMRGGFERARDEDYCSWTILERDGLHVNDLRADPRMAELTATRELGFRMYSGVNLQTGDGLHIGTLCVLDTRPRELTPHQRTLLRRLARQVMSLIELRAAQRDLRASVEKLDRLAHEDELTGLLNRRALLRSIEAEAARRQRYGGALSLVLLDIDHFKAINDRFGHPVGDAVLRRIGRCLQQHVRCVDIAGRYGGEEFLIALPQTGLDGARALAEALRERLGALTHDEGPQRVSASLGVAEVHGDEVFDALARADRALYAAKAQGRDRVVVSS
jgi:diguanylate cyclase (GGDEF)-like protein